MAFGPKTLWKSHKWSKHDERTSGVFNLLRDDLRKAKDMTDGNSFVN